MKGDKVKSNFLKALTEAKGIISYASDRANISRQTYYRWIAEDKDFREACEDITEMVIDLVESKLLTNINEGDVTSIIFYLKTKGKKRGYIERFQLEDISDREPVEVNIIMPNQERNEDTGNDKPSED
tara:strand:+ start:2227 stop:2610 length:384 start_codon:yes stop_codon:yes gene_type:complete